MRIVCVGEAMVELSMQGDGQSADIGYAGDTLNTAIYLKRCVGDALDVSFATVLGQDTFSQNMTQFIASERVETSKIRLHSERLPGLYAISTDDQGERSFVYWRENSAARTLFSGKGVKADYAQLEGADVVYFSAITLAILQETAIDDFFNWLKNLGQRACRFLFLPPAPQVLQQSSKASKRSDVETPKRPSAWPPTDR